MAARSKAILQRLALMLCVFMILAGLAVALLTAYWGIPLY